MDSTSLLFAGALVAGFAFLCSFGRKIARFVYLTSKIPGPSFWQLLTVHAKHLISHSIATHLCKLSSFYNYKPWGMWMVDGNFVIVVSDCETAGAVYKNKHTITKSDLFYKQFENLVGRTILTMESGREYAELRKIVNTGLRHCTQEWFLQKLSEPISEFVRKVREKSADGREMDVVTLVNTQLMESAIASFTSAPPDELLEGRQLFLHYVPQGEELLRIQAVNPIYYWFVRHLPRNKQILDGVRNVLSLLDNVVMKEKSRALVGDDARGIIQTMIQSSLKTMQGSDQEMCQIVRILIAAKVETTPFVINVLFIMLALHQDVQQLVFDEISEILGREERPIVLDDLDRMKYTEMVIKETLRFFPPVALTSRQVLEETNLNGTVVPKGSVVVINNMALHRNPEYFPDPLKFDPNRFSPEASKELPPYSYIPFSAGVRSCPGQVFAFTSMKLFLLFVLKNFKILPGDKLKSLDNVNFKMKISLTLEESSLRFVDRFPRKA